MRSTIAVALIAIAASCPNTYAGDTQPSATGMDLPAQPSTTSPPVTENEVVQSFDRHLERWEKFFRSGQIAFGKQTFPDSPTGFIFGSYRYTLVGNVAYDIQKTDSLVSPYTAHITMQLKGEDSKNCRRDVRYGWNSLDSMLAALNASCYAPSDILPLETIRFNFALQRGRWIWKSAIRSEYKQPAIVITAAFGDGAGVGIPLPEHNKHWLELLEN